MVMPSCRIFGNYIKIFKHFGYNVSINWPAYLVIRSRLYQIISIRFEFESLCGMPIKSRYETVQSSLSVWSY